MTMNTLGKLLVIVNLLFALLTGAFLAVDFVAREKWRQVAEDRQAELEVVKADHAADMETKRLLLEELKKRDADLQTQQTQSQAKIGQMNVKLEQAQKQLAIEKELAAAAILNHQQAIAEAKRLQAEVALLANTLKEREAQILDAQQRATNYLNIATAREAEYKSAQARSENLFRQLKEKELFIAKLQAATPGGNEVARVVSVRDPSFSNPPPVNVKGLIQKIDSEDRSLVQISIGSDAGLQKDNTLEVYRLSPSPQYLGRLRLLEVHQHVALGRVVRPAGMTGNLAVVEGDQVAASLRD
jgi:hypothetical protein